MASAANDAPLQAAGVPFFPDRRLAVGDLVPPLPAFSCCRHFINLTNGLEALPVLIQLGIQPEFVRIQSTMCEQGHFERLVTELDTSLLLRLALGHCCLVYDYGSRNKKRGAPRAIWYGLEFLRYALERIWLGKKGRAFLRGHDVSVMFEEVVGNLSASTRKRLRYYAKFMPPEGLEYVQLYGVYRETVHDIDFNYYRSITHDWLQPGDASGEEDSDSVKLPACIETLHGEGAHDTVEKVLRMRLFLGGLSRAEYLTWQQQLQHQ